MARLERLPTLPGINEKVIFIIMFVCSIFLYSCRTTGVYDNIESTTETRNHIGELQKQQAEIAGNTEAVNAGIQRVKDDNKQATAELDRTREEIGKLEIIIKDGTQQDIEFATILREIYKQPAGVERYPP